MTDLRQTFRRLAADPAFTLVVVLTLGLGIGVNTAIFSAVHRLILAPLPFEDGDRLAFVWREAQSGMMVTPDTKVAHTWLDAREAIDGVALWRHGTATLMDGGEPERMEVSRITPGLPALLGVRPVLGRVPSRAEARERAPVALISEGLWRGRYGGRRDMAGQAIRLDDVVHTVIGVMPDRFGGFDGQDGNDQVWTPLAAGDVSGMPGSVGALVRVREGFTLDQASDEIHRLATGADEAAADEWRYRAVPPQAFLGNDTRSALYVLLGAVTVVLLIACANIAALLLVRIAGRRRDLAVRTALGAPRARLLRALAVELLVLAVLGGAAGVLMATWSIDAIHALRPPQVNGLASLQMGGVVLLYACGLALATALLFGLGPAIALLRRDMGSPFRTAMGSGDRVADGGKARAGLVVGQIALSVALLAGAALLVRTVASLRSADIGIRAESLLTLSVHLPTDRYQEEAIGHFVERTNEALRSIPGVAAATDAMGVPPGVGITHGQLWIEGAPEPDDDSHALYSATFAGPGYFHVLGARVTSGRDITAADIGQEVAVVDRRFAEAQWPGQSPIGKRFRLSRDGEWTTVIGVAADMAVHGPSRGQRGTIFWANRRSFERQNFVLRATAGDPAALAPAVRAALADVDPLLPIERIETVQEQLAATIATERFLMVLLSAFAGLAALLSALGLYGLIAFALARRTREIGIRLALGAAPGDVRDLLLRHGALLAGAGIALGLVGAWAGTRTVEGLLHGVAPRDPLSFAAAAVLIATTALLASWIPARKATRVDPVVTLKSE